MMPAGTYWIGDLCYVMHDEWDEFCELTIKGNQCVDGEFQLKDGRRFAQYHTAYGDGTYADEDGSEYGVDAGLLGCIMVKDIDDAKPENDLGLGHVVTFNYPFHTESVNGKIAFGHILIDTDPPYEDEEEDEEEWE